LNSRFGQLFGNKDSQESVAAPVSTRRELARREVARRDVDKGEKEEVGAAEKSKKRQPATAPPEAKRPSAQEKKELDSRTMFVGNVPLEWGKNHLKKRIREAAEPVYDGPMKPIWFRCEPMEEKYRGFGKKKKAGSIQQRFSTTLNDSRIAYVMLRSSEDVKKVSHHLQGLEADSRHVLQFDGVGEWSKNAKMDRKRSIFIGHLPADTTDADIRDTFSKFGEVLTVRIVRDKFTQACKGIAFVKFKDRNSVKAALAKWDSVEVKGRWVRVKKIEEKAEEVLAKQDISGLHPAEMRKELSRRRHVGKRLASEIADVAERKATPQARPKDEKMKAPKLKGKEGSKMQAKKAKKGAQAKKLKAKERKGKV